MIKKKKKRQKKKKRIRKAKTEDLHLHADLINKRSGLWLVTVPFAPKATQKGSSWKFKLQT